MTQSPTGVGADIVGGTLRVSVLDGRSRTDLVVPVWMQVSDLAAEIADRLGLPDPPGLLLASGRPLAPEVSLEESGLRHGSVVLVDPASLRPADAQDDEAPAEGEDRPWWVPGWVVDLAAVMVVVAAVAAAWGGGELLQDVTSALLLLVAVVALVPGGDAGLRSQRLHLVPWCLGGAALVGVAPVSENPLLPVAVAALGGFAAAGLLRALTEDHVVSLVWLWGAGVVAVVATGLLVLGAGPAGLSSALLVVALAWVRLLPTLVVDVPDDTLLDLDNLAITAWSARDDQPRGTRRRRVVRGPQLATLAHHGSELLRAGTAGAAAVAAISAAVLLAPVSSDGLAPWAVVGGQLHVGAAAAAVALIARAYRDWRLQVVLRLAALVMALILAHSVVGGLGASAALLVSAVLAVLAAAVVWAATALGRGWRSVWWARVADVLQGFCLALTVALSPLSSGLFDAVWRFTS